MPGVLVGDTSTDPALAQPAFAHSSLPHLCDLRRYGPVLTRSVIPDFRSDVELPLSQLSPLPQPAGLNVSLLPDICTDDGSSLDPNLLLQLSPASTGQWGCNNASPTTLSALSALRQFLPSNFEEDEGCNSPHLEMYAGDEFRMYEFKVRRCTRGRSHDWTECPFAHPGEKARRRDPRRFHYSGTACVDFRRGSCKKGDACEYAHGVFECWLHPSRYRTQPCKDGRGCRRRICFFAHTHDQLRLGSSVSSVSALSSSTSLHFCPAMEAFELCGCLSPTRSPVKKVVSESLKSPHTTSPLSRMAMEAPSGGCFMSNFSLTSPSTRSPPSSPPSSTPPTSSPMAHINWSLSRGVSTFALPAPMMPHLHPSWDLNQTQASLTSVPTQGGHWERHNQSLSLPIPQVQGGSKSALPSSTSTTLYTTTQVTEQVEKNAMLWPGGRSSMPETSTKKGCRRTSEEETLLGQFCDEEDEAEPKLERVESGKGLRAQIFQNLLRSSCQPSCRTYQESNLEPLSSSSLGF